MFIFADTDLKFDQPQAEVVFDRDKLRSQGVDLSQAGQDLSTMLGGNYVNRFSIQGRSYKVIPQIKRAERLTPDQLSQIYVKGSNDKLVPLSTFATLKTTTEPRDAEEIPAAQCGSHSGSDSAARAARQGADLPGRPEPKRFCRKASPLITRANRASCAWKAASSSARSCSRRS